MENLEVKVKELSDENDRLKSENTKLLTRVHTLEMEVQKKIHSFSTKLLLFFSNITERIVENV